mmetsp:Transcript_20349/g.81359  ORF Transcript_20349/g.81359 Transcript_20349/m.81359 type:complete len:258 (+) Transcript_20349:715-1488(+)
MERTTGGSASRCVASPSRYAVVYDAAAAGVEPGTTTGAAVCLSSVARGGTSPKISPSCGRACGVIAGCATSPIEKTTQAERSQRRRAHASASASETDALFTATEMGCASRSHAASASSFLSSSSAARDAGDVTSSTMRRQCSSGFHDASGADRSRTRHATLSAASLTASGAPSVVVVVVVAAGDDDAPATTWYPCAWSSSAIECAGSASASPPAFVVVVVVGVDEDFSCDKPGASLSKDENCPASSASIAVTESAAS